MSIAVSRTGGKSLKKERKIEKPDLEAREKSNTWKAEDDWIIPFNLQKKDKNGAIFFQCHPIFRNILPVFYMGIIITDDNGCLLEI